MKWICLLAATLLTQVSMAQLRLPSFLNDHMVLQQHKSNRIWGWAVADQMITVEFKEKKYLSYANKNGEWQVFLDPQDAGDAGSIKISAGNEKIELKNILIGEVWICSGQSNMEMTMGQLNSVYQQEIDNAHNDNIRFVLISQTFANTQQAEVQVDKKWAAISPSTIANCSAVAYWYGKLLNKELKVPIGLVVCSWGGTPAQAWTSLEGLHDFPVYSNSFIEKIKPMDLAGIGQRRQQIKADYQKAVIEKAGLVAAAVKPDFDDSQWKEMKLPGQWETQGYPNLDGIVIYREQFSVAAADQGKEAILNMPAIDDMDSTFINGVFIGTTYQWNAIRQYKIPVGVLKAGKNILAIKVQDDGGGGGLDNVESQFNILVNNKKIPLAGNARFDIVAEMTDITGGNGEIKVQPTVLFNGMIGPLLPLCFQGAIWYQGESNEDKPFEYRKLLPNMIADWRNHWGQGAFPFIFVQLTSYGPLKTAPSQSNWAVIREGQTKTLSVPNTAMAVTIDLGDPLNLHPPRKREIGERLAQNALKMVYGESKRICSGPQLSGFTVEGNKMILRFTGIGTGLMMKGPQLKHFAIAAADGKFIWADAQIKNNTVIVSSKAIKKPVAVRYAWADSPVDANLYNKEGYPAAPFRTDEWKVD